MDPGTGRGRTGSGPAPAGRSALTWLTSAVDGLDHAVADDEFARRSAGAHGRFAGVCEAVVWPTSLATPPAGRCPDCAARLGSAAPEAPGPRWRSRFAWRAAS